MKQRKPLRRDKDQIDIDISVLQIPSRISDGMVKDLHFEWDKKQVRKTRLIALDELPAWKDRVCHPAYRVLASETTDLFEETLRLAYFKGSLTHEQTEEHREALNRVRTSVQKGLFVLKSYLWERHWKELGDIYRLLTWAHGPVLLKHIQLLTGSTSPIWAHFGETYAIERLAEDPQLLHRALAELYGHWFVPNLEEIFTINFAREVLTPIIGEGQCDYGIAPLQQLIVVAGHIPLGLTAQHELLILTY